MIRPVLLVWALLLPAQVLAHALQPGFLDLAVQDAATWRVTWRVPDVNGTAMAIAPVLPSTCQSLSEPVLRFDGAAHVAVWMLSCPEGLAGTDIAIAGLAQTQTDVLVRYELEPGRGGTLRLTPDAPGLRLPKVPSTVEVLRTYLALGVEHILSGADHLLFVLALLLLVPDRRSLIWAITAFTLGHSISLAAATLGWVVLPAPPVEAVIALSIMFLARELAVPAGQGQRWTERHPGAIAAGFGLIHGLGFARALLDIGLPQGEVPTALFAFNLGVEAGQLLFVAVVLATSLVLSRLLPLLTAGLRHGGAWPRQLAAYAIGTTSALWFVERIAAF